MTDPKGQLIYCRWCETAHPAFPMPQPVLCPACDAPGNWTTTPPYHLTRDDKHFLKVNKIRP